jgi:hypothetical protein
MMMPTYRGNVGNLLQHWTVCELVDAANACWSSLRFVDAYAMAPVASERSRGHWSSGMFDYVRDRTLRDSVYERTWSSLAPAGGYPNSAAFVAALWHGSYSMLLCELDPATAFELRKWKEMQEQQERCTSIEIAEGDWRERFQHDVAMGSGLLFLSFDPDMFSCSEHSSNGRNVSPSDLARVASALPA